ncbi:MAG: FecR domain-containing protein [Tannerellaceae bacterium]|jgi:ferric-dicitrate binding protein FerR (iron transport regulator)|nr:FecR domain-containing protein [Tannerellaceae bacterium]
MTVENRHKEYRPYGVEDLLQDKRFISSVTHPTHESDDYWNKALREGIANERDYELAHYFILSVQVRPEPLQHNEIDNLWEDIEIKNKQNLRKRQKRFRLYFSVLFGATAILAGLLIYNNVAQRPVAGIYSSGIEHIKAPAVAPTDIQLVLAGDEMLSLEGKEAEITYREEGIAINNHETDLRNPPADAGQTVVFNQLIVPLGKRSMLTFAEGSRMWVNAGSRVVYPAVFDKKQREIYVDGEVFLEVATNPDCPFVVRTATLNVEALGTSFNVMAYAGDTVQNVVLVSGSVKVRSGSGTEDGTLLAPNEMYRYDASGPSQVQSVNIENYIAWKSGAYQYESESLDVILKRLSRYYGKDILCDPHVARLRCSGKLDLKDDLDRVLKGISRTAPVICRYDGKHYTVTNK